MSFKINSTTYEYLEDNYDKFYTILQTLKNEYWSKENFLKELPNKFQFSLHATINEILVGYIIASSKNNTAYIHKFMVDHEYRGKKIGYHLLNRFFEITRQLNYNKVELTVNTDNLPAIKFYLKNGFIISGSRPDCVTGNKLINMIKSDKKDIAVSIHQPNFLPWLGYFDKIARCDTFIVLDGVQLVQGKSYTCRVKILCQGKEKWLTVPVMNKSDKLQISESKVDNKQNWKKKHLKTIYLNYKKSTFFEEIYEHINKVYDINSDYLVDYNIEFIKSTCSLLGLNKIIINSSDIPLISQLGSEKIIELIQSAGGTKYISGNGAGSQRYINEEEFINNQIELIWQPNIEFIYPQINTSQFVKNLSIIDVLFNAKDKLMNYLTNLETEKYCVTDLESVLQ